MQQDIDALEKAISGKLGILISSLVQMIAGLTRAFVLSWELSLIALSPSPLMWIGGGVLGYYLPKEIEEESEWYATCASVASEVLYAIRTVAAFGGEERSMARYEAALVPAKNSQVRGNFAMGCGVGLLMAGSFMIYAACYWFSGSVLIGTERTNPATGDPWDGASIVEVMISFMMGMMGSNDIGMNSTYLITGKAAAGRIHRILRQVSEQEQNVDGTPPQVSELRLEDVRFTYPSRPDVPILNGVSLVIAAGQKVAFVGESGCGKSTVMALLEQFYAPAGGRLLVNGEDLGHIAPSVWRRALGYVGQEPVMFAGTIRHNITLGNDADDATVLRVCEQAMVTDFTKNMESGLDTYLGGGGGGGLSGGQKQRVAIARALARNPQVLLLDEATSALDNKSEREVQQTLDALQQSLRITTIAIAHRLSTVMNSDRIFVFHQGAVVEQGSPKELMALKQRFRALVDAQKLAEGDWSAYQERRATERRTERRTEQGVTGETKDERSAEEKLNARIKAVVEGGKYQAPLRRLFGLSSPWKWFYIPALLGAAVSGASFPVIGYFLGDAMGRFYVYSEVCTESPCTIDVCGIDEFEIACTTFQAFPGFTPGSRVPVFTLDECDQDPRCSAQRASEDGSASEQAQNLIPSEQAQNLIPFVPTAQLVLDCTWDGDCTTEEAYAGCCKYDRPAVVDALNEVGFIFLAVALVTALGQLLSLSCFGVIGNNLALVLRKQAFQQAARQEIGFHDDPEFSAGAVSHAIAMNAQRVSSFASVRVGAVVNLFFALATGLSLSLYANWRLSLATLGFLPLVFLGQMAVFMSTVGGGEAGQAHTQAMVLCQEATLNLRTVRALQAEAAVEQVFTERLRVGVTTELRKVKLASIVSGSPLPSISAGRPCRCSPTAPGSWRTSRASTPPRCSRLAWR